MINYLWDNIFKKSGSASIKSLTLKNNLLFQDLGARDLQLIEAIVHQRNYQPGEYIFRQGEIGVGMYLLAKGAVDIIVDHGEAEDTTDKQKSLLTKLTVGDFFGELALVEENGRRSASAVASTDCVLLGLFRPDLLHLLDSHPEGGGKVALRLAEVLGRRLRETTDRIAVLKNELQHLQNQRSKS